MSKIALPGIMELRGPESFSFTRDELTEMTGMVTHNERHAYSLTDNKGIEPPDYTSIIDIRLVPAKMENFSQAISLTEQYENGKLTVDVPAGKFFLYVMVIREGYNTVCRGTHGANGPVLDHYNRKAVEDYFNRMSEKIGSATGGPPGKSFRATMMDSLEEEGANWCTDMPEEFRKRRGYDLMPYLPFVLFKREFMGNRVKEDYGANFSEELDEIIRRVRYDMIMTLQELFHERFIKTYTDWCTRNGLKSRYQAYGRGPVRRKKYHQLRGHDQSLVCVLHHPGTAEDRQ